MSSPGILRIQNRGLAAGRFLLLIAGLWPAFLLLTHVIIIRLIRVHANRGYLLPEQLVRKTKPPAPASLNRAACSRPETIGARLQTPWP